MIPQRACHVDAPGAPDTSGGAAGTHVPVNAPSCDPDTLRALVSGLPDATVVVDDQDRVLYANPAAGRLIERDPGTWVGCPVGITIVTDPTSEVGLACSHGDERILEMRVAPLAWEGQAARIVTMRDVTARSKLEEALRLGVARDTQRETCGRIARDYRDLLTTILCGAQLVEEAATEGDDVVGLAQRVTSAARDASTLTRRLLSAAGARVCTSATTDLDHLVRSFECRMRPLIEERITLTVDVDAQRAALAINPTHLEHVLTLLVQNACDALPDQGHLTIATSLRTLASDALDGAGEPAPGQYAVLTVTDTGAGMSPETRERLFDAYYSTKPERPGRGLGLAEVYGLISQVGGFIDVESELGSGARIEVLIPLMAGGPQTEHGISADAPYAALMGKTILLAEDEEGIRRLLAEVFHQVGASVIHAADVPKAESLLEQLTGEIDLLVCDVRMPGGTGLDIVRASRAQGDPVPAILISGYSAHIPDEHMPAGAVSFLPKPFLPGAMLQQACEMLRAADKPDSLRGA